MYRNRIDLKTYGTEKNKEFMKMLHSAGLEKCDKLFDKLDCNISLARQLDSEMDAEKFLTILDKGIETATLQIGSIYDRRPNDIEHTIISYSVIPRFAWLKCPCTQENYKIVSNIFEEAFGESLESLKVPDYLKPYYEKLEKDSC
jgi:hypothetical protein